MAFFRDHIEYETEGALDLLVTLEEAHRHLLEAATWTTLLLAVYEEAEILRGKLLI